MSELFAKLKAPFPPDRISWRIGSTTADKKRGLALAYIDARDVMQRLDDVCGPDGWQCRYPHATAKTVCEIGIRCGEEWIWKADGAGDTDVEAEKGALSDAYKRAAVRWGIGRYLYDVASPWVEIEPMGRSFKIKDSELQRLAKSIGGSVQQHQPAETKPVMQLLSEPAATAEERKLVEEVGGCVTYDELDKFIRGDNFKNRFGKLPARHQGHVRNAFKARADKLKPKEEAAA